MRYLSVFATLTLASLLGTPASAQDLGSRCTEGGKCLIENGYYHTALPEVTQGAPVILWLHGYGGKADRQTRAAGLPRNFLKQGFVFVAPQGAPDPSNPDHRDWNVRDGHDQPRDDITFLTAVLDDVFARLGTDPNRVLLAGFSRGASMAWDYACARPDRIAGMAVASGGFWEPMMSECAGPVHLFHTHGFNDRTVPLEGRKTNWGGLKFHQGNIMKGLDIWREVNNCTGAADTNVSVGPHWEKQWNTCSSGSIRLQLTPRGHGIPKGWSLDVLDWFESLSSN